MGAITEWRGRGGALGWREMGIGGGEEYGWRWTGGLGAWVGSWEYLFC